MTYEFHWAVVEKAMPELLEGLFVTFHVSMLSMVFGIIFGILLALAKQSEYKIFSYFSSTWIEISRNTPALFQIYMAYFGLGALGIHLDPYFAVLSALTFLNAGYLAETFRGGLNAISKSQFVAGRSLGMNIVQLYWYIILPQMFRNIFYPLTNQFVWAILLSSLGILVGMDELSGTTQRLQSISFRTLEFFIVAAIMYYVLAKVVLFSANLYANKILFKDKP